MKARLQSLPWWLQFLGLVTVLLAFGVVLKLLAGDGTGRMFAVAAAVPPGATAWEIVPVLREREATVTRAAAFRAWLQSQSRPLAILGVIVI